MSKYFCCDCDIKFNKNKTLKSHIDSFPHHTIIQKSLKTRIIDWLIDNYRVLSRMLGAYFVLVVVMGHFDFSVKEAIFFAIGVGLLI